MAMFRKQDGLPHLVDALSKPGLPNAEIDELIERVTTHPDATPRRLGTLVTSDNPRIREAGIGYVVRNAGRDCADLLLMAMIGAERPVRTSLARALVGLSRQDVLRTTERAFNSRKSEHRPLALEIVFADPRWRDHMRLLKAAVRDPDAGLRLAAVRILRRKPDDDAIGVILRGMIHDGDDVVRAEVIGGLCEHPTPDLIEPFFARVLLEEKPERARMIQALGKLCRSGVAGIELRLYPSLADENGDIRMLAARLLDQVGDKSAALRGFLVYARGLAPWLRERATEALLGVVGGFTAPLIELMDDADDDIAVAAMTLASHLDDPAIVPHVARIFGSKLDWWVRSMAADILARFPTDEVLGTLLSRLDDPELRYSVVSALGATTHSDACGHLLECLGDPAASIRRVALDGLRREPTEAIVAAVHGVARDDADVTVREKALQMLRDFGAIAEMQVAELERAAQRRADRRPDAPALELEMANTALNPASGDDSSAAPGA